MRRRRRDLPRVSLSWQVHMHTVQQSARSYDDVVCGLADGGMRARLTALQPALDRAVDATRDIATRATELEELGATLPPTGDLRRRLSHAPEGSPRADAARQQLDVALGIQHRIRRARERVELLEAQLAIAVAHAVELATTAVARAPDPSELVSPLASELDAIRAAVGEIEDLTGLTDPEPWT